MGKLEFREKLLGYVDEFKRILSTPAGDWSVKGFIDVAKNIYTISADTKVISKIIELMMFPTIHKFSQDNNYKMVLSEEQNHYPDVTFVDSLGKKIALDIKSTYRINRNLVSGFTLGGVYRLFPL